MKSVFIAMNSKYIHSSLAPWYLKACCGNSCGLTKVMEFTINDLMDTVLAGIFKEQPDAAAFSCYIWNIEQVLKLAENLKKLIPAVKILLGGPEVSYDAAELLESYAFIDYVISGEGEIGVPLLLQHLERESADSETAGRESADREGMDRETADRCTMDRIAEESLESIPGLSWRRVGGEICVNEAGLVENLDKLPSPYTEEMLESIGKRITYYESSRGCPFSCSYCLSSLTNGVRYFSMERVRSDIRRLAESGTRQIKFVDRTFNCRKDRAAEIFKFIIDHYTSGEGKALLNFHFEAAADLFDDRVLEMLERAPEGLIQFEIGVQTVNPVTLEAIHRKTDMDKLFNNFNRIRKMGNIHLHLDLIAGLPYEDLISFGKSFDRVYGAKPHQLQLGFLKLLKGSEIREKGEEHGYVFKSTPTYEILYNKYLNFDDLILLKGIEELLDRYFNSGRFVKSLEYLIDNGFSGAFDFFRGFYEYYCEKDLVKAPRAAKEMYAILSDFAERTLQGEKYQIFLELLRFDFLSSDTSGTLPESLKREEEPGFRERAFDFLKSGENIHLYLPGHPDIPAKKLFKQVHFERFEYDIQDLELKKREIVILFDYTVQNPVTGIFKHVRVDI